MEFEAQGLPAFETATAALRSYLTSSRMNLARIAPSF
jgi:hypothetical protein